MWRNSILFLLLFAIALPASAQRIWDGRAEYGLYDQASEGFVERYFALLSAGGSKPYGELLAPFGLDARDPAFWQIGLAMIERLIGELELMEPA